MYSSTGKAGAWAPEINALHEGSRGSRVVTAAYGAESSGMFTLAASHCRQSAVLQRALSSRARRHPLSSARAGVVQRLRAVLEWL